MVRNWTKFSPKHSNVKNHFGPRFAVNKYSTFFTTKLHNRLGTTLWERRTQTLKRVLNQLVLARDENTIFDGTTVLVDGVFDDGEESGIMQDHQLRTR